VEIITQRDADLLIKKPVGREKHPGGEVIKDGCKAAGNFQ